MKYIAILFFRVSGILLWQNFQKKHAEITITCLAPSKTFNLAGLSTSSVIISNPALRKSFNSIVEKLHVGNGNIFGSVASVAAYTYGAEWLDELLGI